MKRCEVKIISCGSCRHPEFMTRKNAGLRPADFPSLVGVIVHPDEGVILFDTGYDAAFFEATKLLPEKLYRWTTPVELPEKNSALDQLAALGYKASDVKRIVISHFHGDHVAGLHNFPQAKITCSKRGMEELYKGSRFTRTRKGILSALAPDDLPARATFFEDCKSAALPPEFHPFTRATDVLGDGSLLAVELPGHCPGHWGLALKTQKDRFTFLVADAAWSIKAVENNNPPPKITMKLLGCTADYYKTLGGLSALQQANRGVFILPSHCTIAAKHFEKETA